MAVKLDTLADKIVLRNSRKDAAYLDIGKENGTNGKEAEANGKEADNNGKDNHSNDDADSDFNDSADTLPLTEDIEEELGDI